MPSALEKIVESFPHPTVTPIVGQTSYETIAELLFVLYQVYEGIQIWINPEKYSVHKSNELVYIVYVKVIIVTRIIWKFPYTDN